MLLRFTNSLFLRFPLFHLDDLNIQRESQYCSDPSQLIQFFKGVSGNSETDGSVCLRCPDSCMLENWRTSPPFCWTSPTRATYLFLSFGSLALCPCVRGIVGFSLKAPHTGTIRQISAVSPQRRGQRPIGRGPGHTRPSSRPNQAS
jgi:hypothetical protein